jgi:ADP-ribose pyrophosphatase YjhB (NUDIX family)
MERKILELFLYANKLKFNEIEKGLKVRSNKLNYHLQKLVKKRVLIKIGEFYHLSESSEYLVPYLSNKKHVLSVILIHIGDSKKGFLVRREKRPYKGMLGLPGGRMIVGESIKEGAERIVKKFGIDAKFEKVNSISLEHLKKNGKIIHSFMLYYVSASAKEELIDINKNKSKIIASDYKLITGDYGKRVEIRTINSKIK